MNTQPDTAYRLKRKYDHYVRPMAGTYYVEAIIGGYKEYCGYVTRATAGWRGYVVGDRSVGTFDTRKEAAQAVANAAFPVTQP